MSNAPILEDIRCWYCDQLNVVDHKHGSGASCGDCCGMHGSLAHAEPAAYKWIKECIRAKNERIAAIEAERDAPQRKVEGQCDGYLGDYAPHSAKCRCTDCQLERVQADLTLINAPLSNEENEQYSNYTCVYGFKDALKEFIAARIDNGSKI